MNGQSLENVIEEMNMTVYFFSFSLLDERFEICRNLFSISFGN